ncbi:hypothetical protein LTR53_003343 [Teratosphaeriaceae sp. CCFEE 6253]|nr:hypothetical protein LTR53_003343 [Teratosphaeriaceae sp. CCFEE 6253]
MSSFPCPPQWPRSRGGDMFIPHLPQQESQESSAAAAASSHRASHRQVTTAVMKREKATLSLTPRGEAHQSLKAERVHVKEEVELNAKRGEPSPVTNQYTADEANVLKQQWKHAGRRPCTVPLPTGQACAGYHHEALHNEMLAVAAWERRHSAHAHESQEQLASGNSAEQQNPVVKHTTASNRDAEQSHKAPKTDQQQAERALPPIGQATEQAWSRSRLLSYASHRVTSVEAAERWARVMNTSESAVEVQAPERSWSLSRFLEVAATDIGDAEGARNWTMLLSTAGVADSTRAAKHVWSKTDVLRHAMDRVTCDEGARMLRNVMNAGPEPRETR